jgi:folylpolyglutamate synthase/dihydropteroate synthase
VFVAPPLSRAVDPNERLSIASGEVAPSIELALERARTIVGTKGLVVVTGSTFLVGAARSILLNLPTDPAVDL